MRPLPNYFRHWFVVFSSCFLPLALSRRCIYFAGVGGPSPELAGQMKCAVTGDVKISIGHTHGRRPVTPSGWSSPHPAPPLAPMWFSLSRYETKSMDMTSDRRRVATQHDMNTTRKHRHSRHSHTVQLQAIRPLSISPRMGHCRKWLSARCTLP